MTRYMPTGTVPPPPTIPGPPAPPYQFPPAPPGPGRRRVWPSVLAAGAAGAVVAATIATLITGSVRDTATPAPKAAPVVTVTVAPPAPAPLGVDEANRHTCEDGLLATVAPARAAAAALKTLPPGVKIADPQVRDNPEWAAAVRRAGDYSLQVSDILRNNIAPGTTPILAAAAETAANAFHAKGDAYKGLDALNGNAHDIAKATSDEMAVLCERLAP